MALHQHSRIPKAIKADAANLQEAVDRQRLELESKQIALKAAEIDKQLAATKFETARLKRLALEQEKALGSATTSAASPNAANPLISPSKRSKAQLHLTSTLPHQEHRQFARIRNGFLARQICLDLKVHPCKDCIIIFAYYLGYCCVCLLDKEANVLPVSKALGGNRGC